MGRLDRSGNRATHAEFWGAADWMDCFGGYREFHLAMTRYMVFGTLPAMPPGDDMREGWQTCMMRFYNPAISNVMVQAMTLNPEK